MDLFDFPTILIICKININLFLVIHSSNNTSYNNTRKIHIELSILIMKNIEFNVLPPVFKKTIHVTINKHQHCPPNTHRNTNNFVVNLN